MKTVYLPTTSIESIMQSEDEILFKHEDCSIVFSTDGDFIYATDIDDPKVDIFASCRIESEFKAELISHYLDLELIKRDLGGRNLRFSDALNMADVLIDDVLTA